VIREQGINSMVNSNDVLAELERLKQRVAFLTCKSNCGVNIAYYLSARAVHNIIRSRPIIELRMEKLEDFLAKVRKECDGTVSCLMDPRFDHSKLTNLLVGTWSMKFGSLPLSDDSPWRSLIGVMHVIPQHIYPTARAFVAQHWDEIQLVTANLLCNGCLTVAEVIEILNPCKRDAA
jgi:hypothetical protein